MASAYLLPLCGVCNSPFKYGGPEPYLLPCLHSTCNDCLNKESTNISCSHCWETFSKQDYIFLKDTVTQSEIFHSTLKNKPSEIKCTNKMHKNVAIVWCKDCQVFYCKTCQVAHSQIKSSHAHVMVVLKDLAPGGTLGRKSKCPDHDSYDLDLYDVTCEILICSKCARTDHKQCQNEELRTAGREDMDLLLKDQKKLEGKLRDVITNLEYINKKQRESEAGNENIKRGISHQFDTLRVLITKRERELMSIFDQKHNSIKDEIKKVNNRLERSAEKMQAAHDYTKKLLARDNPEDFLMLKNNVKSRAQLCVTEELDRAQVTAVTISFSQEKLDELKTLVSSCGDITWLEEEDSDSVYGNSVRRSDSVYQNTDVDIGSQEPDPSESSSKSKGSKAQSTSIDYIQGVVEPYVNVEATQETQSTSTDYIQGVVEPYVNVEATQETQTDYIQAVVEQYVNVEAPPGNKRDSDTDTQRVTGVGAVDEEHIYTECMSGRAPSCPRLIFDIERVNTLKTHINNDGYLLNTKLPSGKMFSTYVGTTSVHPLPKHELAYWEVETDIGFDEEMQTYGLLMEIGVAEGENTDRQYCVSGQSNSKSLSIAYCSNHKGICAKIWNHGTKMGCKEEVIFNKGGGSYPLKHGILHDGERDVLIFFDLIKMKQIEILKGQGSAGDVWPIFGVFSPTLASVKMRLIAGIDVLLNDEKLSLFENAGMSKCELGTG